MINVIKAVSIVLIDKIDKFEGENCSSKTASCYLLKLSLHDALSQGYTY